MGGGSFDGGESCSDRLQTGMQQITDVADAQPREPTDFLVAQATFDLEANDFLLSRRKAIHQGVSLVRSVATLGDSLGVAFGTGWRRRVIVEGFHSVFLLQDVESSVAADGVEPLTDMAFDLIAWLRAETNERVLHDIAGAIRVTHQMRRVSQQWSLEFLEHEAQPSLVR